jgi:hypothetical protein
MGVRNAPLGKLMAIWRISWIDRRIKNDASVEAARFFEHWPGVGPVTNDGHHGEGKHDEGDMAMPAMSGAGFVVIKAELVLGGFEAMDGPAMAFHRRQLLH